MRIDMRLDKFPRGGGVGGGKCNKGTCAPFLLNAPQLAHQ